MSSAQEKPSLDDHFANYSFMEHVGKFVAGHPAYVAASVASGAVVGYGTGFFFIKAPSQYMRHRHGLVLGVPLVMPWWLLGCLRYQVGKDAERLAAETEHRLVVPEPPAASFSRYS